MRFEANKLFNYILDLTLSNKYLEVIVKFFEPKILNEKIDVLFDLLILKNKTNIFKEKSIIFTNYQMYQNFKI